MQGVDVDPFVDEDAESATFSAICRVDGVFDGGVDGAFDQQRSSGKPFGQRQFPTRWNNVDDDTVRVDGANGRVVGGDGERRVLRGD